MLELLKPMQEEDLDGTTLKYDGKQHTFSYGSVLNRVWDDR